MSGEQKILRSELAGSWYPDDRERLEREIDTYLSAADPPRVDGLIGLVLPHAGYRYSGMVAARGVRLLEGRGITRVVVLGPSHRVAMLDRVSIPDVSHVETPLGRLALDAEVVARLRGDARFESEPRAHEAEHSVQIELPLLQRVLGDFKLVPIVCGELDAASAAAVAEKLLPELDAETLLVVSTDFTHYGAAFDYVPFGDDIKGQLERLDMGAFRLVERGDLDGFQRYVRDTGATICGHAPLSVMLALMGAGTRVELLKYETSGNLTGDWGHCVSYLSAAVAGSWRRPAASGALTAADQAALLAFARREITKRFRLPRGAGPEIGPAADEVMGAFVTLHKQGDLRGCIGEIFPRRPLREAVAEHALNAAFHDPRFPRLREEELPEVDIEISALTPPVAVDSARDIEVGRHGIVLRRGGHSAVFLPQVAPEQGWGLEETLSRLAMKAGLDPEAWRAGCEFLVFEAVVFGERG